MFGRIVKSCCRYFNAGWKSYCAVKISEKTGMSVPELMLYKGSIRDCGQYYSKKLSIFLKEYAQKSRAKRLSSKMQSVQPQLPLVPEAVPSQNNKLMNNMA